MESNNIDDFFRLHRHKVDEAPADSLWQRIEAELPVGKLPNTSAKSGWLTKLLLLTTGMLGIAAVVYIFSNKAAEKQVIPITIIPGVTVTAPEITKDTVKPKKAISNKKKQQTAEPKKDYVKFRPVNKQKVEIEKNVAPNLSLNPPQPAFKIIRQNAAPAKTPVKITVQFNKKRTVITINEKVSQKVFDSITQESIEQYKNNSGMQLIIKEPRSGNVFRTTFETKMVSYTLATRDSVKKQNDAPAKKVHYIGRALDSLERSDINLIEPEAIRFKTDTIKTIAPAGIMPRYDVNSTTTKEDTKKSKKQR